MMLKKLLAAVGILVVLLIIGIGVLIWRVDAVAKSAVERGGTYALGVPTNLESISIGLLGGDVSLDQLKVANPEGFDGEFLVLDGGEANVSLGTLREETVEVPTVTLRNMTLRLQKREGQYNYKVILENLEKLKSGEKKPEQEGQKKGFVIRTTEIENLTVLLDPEVPGLGEVTVTIPKLVIKDVPHHDKEAVMSELMGEIIQDVLASAVQNVMTNVPQEVLNQMGGLVTGLQDGLGELGAVPGEVVGQVTQTLETATGQVIELTEATAEQAVQAVEKVGEGVGEAAKGVGEGVQKIGEGLGGLIPGKKEQGTNGNGEE